MVSENGKLKEKRKKNINTVQDAKGNWVLKRNWIKGSRLDSRLYLAPETTVTGKEVYHD